MGARLLTKLAAFMAVTCILTAVPGVLTNTNCSGRAALATVVVLVVIADYTVTLIAGQPFTLTPKLKDIKVVTSVVAGRNMDVPVTTNIVF